MKTPGLWKGKAAQGAMPAMGVKMEIEEIERTETSEKAQTPGCLAYIGHYRVLEPAQYKGRRLQEFFTIGTKEDKRAKKDETWDRPEQGPGHLIRLMEKAGVANSDDDDEWMAAAEGCTVYAHVKQETWEGNLRNKVSMYFSEDDEDFVGVGEELAAPAARDRDRGGRKKARGGSEEEPRTARARRHEDDDEKDDEKEEEPEEDEKETKAPRSKRRDEDEDNEPKRAAASARGRRGSRDDDED
jgi:hypothetical protein